ncbi:hypothetical protein PPYR_11912 [Photinus pyralis]|uniref:Centromere/kinetochore protein zw10 homolog n=1 Tax=Photinus pyralis TaxID=7054 RepID=A0A5N4ACL8_PHOPY|nr:centromere/kinetochore protein zw10 homolog [Photinus pyralis]KAB0795073.1 hypothetical protein PPYR_11912 [Photinus pyralis]
MNDLMNALSKSKTDVDSLHKTISKCKAEVISYIEDVYVKYTEWPQCNQKLLKKVKEVLDNVNVVKERFESVTLGDLSAQQEQVDTLQRELHNCQISTSCTISLMEIHEKLLNLKDGKMKDNIIQAASELVHVGTLIMNLPGQELLDVVPSLKSTVAFEKTELAYAVTVMLEEMIVIKEAKAGRMQTYTMKIDKNTSQLRDIINTLRILNQLQSPLDNFRQSFWTCICKPILTSMTLIRTDDEGDFHTLTIVVKQTAPVKSYKDVLDKLLQVFSFVRTHFDYEITDGYKLHTFLGNGVEVELSQMLLRDILPHSDAIKSDSKQIVDDARNFQNELVKLETFAEANAILEYVDGVDAMLVNEKCNQYTVEAITIMKKDLHDMVEVGVHFDADNPLTGDQFPQCTISKSTLELLDKAEKVLLQSLTDPPAMATRTICAMQSIFYQYGSIVYGHHEKLLQTIPQQVVLYRNNCMYLAHRLSQLNDLYSSRFPPEVLPIPPLFKDQSHQLRTVGGDIFLGYVETHIQAMERTLSEYKFEPHQLSENMSPDIDKCFRQCLRQYELLKTVWQKVLPHAVYNKTIGYLVNAFCKRLLGTVLEAPDISVKNCELLVDLYKIVLTRAPRLFTDSEEINLYVDLWQRLNELVFVLTADLVSIEDRWKNGPLSTRFSPDEVRHLIKALFQTTDRRAHVLSQIVSVNKF